MKREKTNRLHCLYVTDIIEILLRQGEREGETKKGGGGRREEDGFGAMEVSVQCLNKMPSLIECAGP